MKYIGGMLPNYWGDTFSPFLPGFAPMLVEFPKNIGKSRDKSYPTDRKTSSVLVPIPFLGSLGFCGRSRKNVSILKKRTTKRGSPFFRIL